MKPKRNYKTSIKEPAALDLCQTPPYAVAPLLEYIPPECTIWDPCSGEGILANALRVAGYKVIESDIALGQDFFEYKPRQHWQVIVTNPPYGIKPAWVERCYELCKTGASFALLMPTEFQGTGAAGELFNQYGVEIMNISPRVDFKMPNEGWFSNAQFPVSWYCFDVIPEPLMFSFLHKPPRTVSKQVWKKDKKTGKSKLVTVWGYADWIERPSGFNWDTYQFEYKEWQP